MKISVNIIKNAKSKNSEKTNFLFDQIFDDIEPLKRTFKSAGKFSWSENLLAVKRIES